MFRNYIKTLFRQLWKNRLFTILNIVGLSVCICVAWIIFRMVSYEYNFDKKFPDVEKIYQVVSRSSDSERPGIHGFAGVSTPVFTALKNDITGAKMVVPMFYKYQHKAVVKNGDEEPMQYGQNDGDLMLVSTNADYFKMLGYKWLAGNAANALDAPDRIVLTDKKAQEFFPNIQPTDLIGKTIVFDDTVRRNISGVVAQLDFPNSFSADNQLFIPLENSDLTDNNWGSMNSNYLVFIKPEKGVDPQNIMKQLNIVNTRYNKDNFEKYKYKAWYDVLPLKDKHFEPQYAAQTRAADKNVLNGLIITGAFLLLLACINYINLSTAMLPKRAREIGIRKTLGSSSRRLILRFMGETAMVTILAAIFSFGLATFAVEIFADFLPDGMLEYMNYGGMVIFMLLLVMLISLLSGLYPAYLSSRVETVNVLKGEAESAVGKRRFTLRKGLIVFQFLIAQVFIIGSIIIHQQINYALHKDLGFNKDGIITIEVPYYISGDPKYKDKQFVLKNELLREANIKGVSIGGRPMDNNMLGNVYSYYNGKEDIQQQLNVKYGDTDYLSVYRFKLLAGRNLLASDTMKELVVNEKAVQAFGFKSPEDALGKMVVSPGSNKRYPIVGVVADFHQFGVQSKIDPALITTNKKYGSNILNVKLTDDVSKWKTTIQSMEKEWKKLYAGVPFKYSFYDETVKKFYIDEDRTQTLVSTATAIAILISCLGLFGLATLTAFQRTKEVGIRKVLGASVAGIAGLLSREFISLVLISVLIASPIAWWMMSKWLEDYAYRINISWWIFLLAAFVACFVALVTVGFQAIKAARANPVKSLRTE